MINKFYEIIKKNIKENFLFYITLIVIVLVFTIELPYGIYTPGGEVNLNNRIKVDGGYETKGKFGMAYVSMVRSSIPFVLASYVMPNWDLVKKEEVTYDDMTIEETFELEQLYMQESVNYAILNAYNKAKLNVEVKKSKEYVSYIYDKTKTELKIKDEILEIDGIKVSSLEDIQKEVSKYKVGETIKVKVKRNKKEKELNTTLVDINGEVKIGIATVDVLTLETDPDIEIKTKSTEAGSSGGLMMSLAIYNSLVKKDITHGYNIMGTGTIDKNGNVGSIDGVKYKLIGAHKNKAKVFLCPKDNYKEAIEIKKEKGYDINIVKVSTLDDAIKYLNDME